MRAILMGAAVFVLGLAAAALVASPRAGARATDGTISGSVGPGASISMSESSVTPGNYTINVSDSETTHNFHFFGPGVDKKTSIAGTGSTSWSVTLQAGTYTFQCDAHASFMNGSLTVADASTTTTATTATTATTSTTTTVHTTTAHTTTAHTTTEATTSEATTTETVTTVPTASVAETTTEAASTTSATTTATAPARKLSAHVATAHAGARSIAVTVASNERGHAFLALFAGGRRIARATGTVPGKLVLRTGPLKPGRYILRLRVTAAHRTTTSSRVIRVA